MQSTSQLQMNQLGTVYATKRRRRNGKSMKPPPKDVTKSNPSKRHRERLNAELDTLASLLPFEQNILSKLDRLSILRLAVSYLRTKSYFQVSMHRLNNNEQQQQLQRSEMTYDHSLIDGELFLQALNGFLLILTCEGEVFFATHSIESYLGFHQSDIVHQSVYELVHSEDREELQRQLTWNAFLPTELTNLNMNETLHNPEHVGFLERSFTVRFRCLLDNTSGFLRLDIRGRVKLLHGQNRKSEEPPLALFALCTPFGPPSLLEVPQKEVMFKSKHKLDLSLVSMDQRGKMLIGYSDGELTTLGGYDLIHFDDLAYFASAHQELLKTGASGLIAYRLQTKETNWQWLQTSSRLVYKNSKPDFIISTHRPLMEEEGRDLLGKRTMDFKVSYLDAGLTNSYFSDQQHGTSMDHSPTPTSQSTPPTGNSSSTKQNGQHHRRYKTQLRDFLTTVRPTKRNSVKSSSNANNPNNSNSTSNNNTNSNNNNTNSNSTNHNHNHHHHHHHHTTSSSSSNHHHHHHNSNSNSNSLPLPLPLSGTVGIVGEDPQATNQYTALYTPQPHVGVVHHPHIQNPITIQPNYNYNYNNEYYNYTSALDFYSFRAINYYNNDYYYNTASDPQTGSLGVGVRPNYDCYNPSAAAIVANANTLSSVPVPVPVIDPGSNSTAGSKGSSNTSEQRTGVIMYSGKHKTVGGQLEDVKPPTTTTGWGIVKSLDPEHLYSDPSHEAHQQQQQHHQYAYPYPTIGANSVNSSNSI